MSGLRLLFEQPEDKGQEEADEEARDEREVEREVPAGVMDIAGQSAYPILAPAGPEHKAHGNQDQAGDNQKFAEVAHPVGRVCRGHRFAKPSPASKP